MKRTLMLLFLGAALLLLAATADVHYLSHQWAAFLAFGFCCVVLHNFILRTWFGPSRWVQVHLLLYLVVFAGAISLRLGVWNGLLGEHRATAGTVHLLSWLRSPVPLMVLIPIFLLRKARVQSA